jgi:hypothetical protein
MGDDEGFERIRDEPSSLVILAGWIVVVLFLVFLVLTTAPLGDLLGPSSWAIVSTLHGTLATLGVLVVTVAAYLGWKLFNGQLKGNSDLRIVSALSALVAAATIIFGNWIYIGYRGPGGPRAFFLQSSPGVHNVFFEFKEHFALFTLPLSVGAAYTVWTYRDTLSQDKPLRTTVALLLMTTWAIFIVSFVLGAAITRLRSV